MYSEVVVVNRTTKLLYRGLFNLLDSTSFDKITVNDICKEALVSRSTFYSYFQDKYHLAVFCLEKESERLGIIKGVDVRDNLEVFLNRVQEEKNVYRNLFIGQENSELQQMIVDRFKTLTVAVISDDIESSEEVKVMSVLYGTGLAGTVFWWINNNFEPDPKTLADYQYSILESM